MAKKVLILSSSLGGGHQSAAEALQRIIQSDSPATKIKIVDMSPPLGSFIYRFLSNYFTEVIVKNYHAFNNDSAARLLQILYAPLIMTKLTPILKQFKPHLIIATHAFSTEAVDLTLKQLGLKIPLIVVLVDPFSIHRTWTVYQQASKYFLPNDYAYRIFKQRGIAADRLIVTGHPLRPIPKQLSLPVGLDPKKLTIFLGGSGEGVGRIDQIIKLLLQHKKSLNNTHLIVACGKNRPLFNQLQKLAKNWPQLIYPYGFTDKIYQLIKASDLVVGKAGPNLMWEVISLGKPILTTGVPLGQEAGNYRFIAKEKLGFVSYTPVRTAKYILQVIKTPQILKQFRPAIRKQQHLLQQTPPKILAALRPFLQI